VGNEVKKKFNSDLGVESIILGGIGFVGLEEKHAIPQLVIFTTQLNVLLLTGGLISIFLVLRVPEGV
jgi:hypothetical protein